jgi:hypothetical protein
MAGRRRWVCGEARTYAFSVLALAVCVMFIVAPGGAFGSESSSLSVAQRLEDPSIPLPDTCSLSGKCEPCPAEELNVSG